MKKILILALLLSFLLVGLAPGTRAPDFTVNNQDGKPVSLSGFKGKFVLIYFYPKDETPGCTKEACDFRDRYSEIKKLNTVVLGISRQGEKSHLEFKSRHHLPFDLLVDPKGKIADSFGVGRIPIIGYTKRQSILIDPQGRVVKFYDSVDPSSHVNEVIADILKAKEKA